MRLPGGQLHALGAAAERVQLAAAIRVPNDTLARQFGLQRQTVCRWPTRWPTATHARAAQEAADLADDPLREQVRAGLTDAPRCGTPLTFTPEQVVGISALACADPAASQHPLSSTAKTGFRQICASARA